MQMKHFPKPLPRTPGPCRPSCPIKCAVCRYDKTVYPARFRLAELENDQTLNPLAGNANHVIFVLEGALHVHTRTKDNYRLSTGQCIFLARETEPVVSAVTPSRVVWLDFTNRIILCRQDCLNHIEIGKSPSALSLPILHIDPVMHRMLDGMHLIDSPCYHLLKQYDLFLVMRDRYTEEELSSFFRQILRPAYDMEAFMLSCYREVQSVGEFAQKANLSESTFVRRFRNVFGMTVHQWMMKQREKDLCNMVSNGERDTNKLAKGIGLVDQTGLYQFCRRRFGCSITEFMNKYTTNNR